MTINWTQYAQSLTKTSKGNAKGLLHSLNWSFVRDDQRALTTANCIGGREESELN